MRTRLGQQLSDIARDLRALRYSVDSQSIEETKAALWAASSKLDNIGDTIDILFANQEDAA